MICSFIHYTFRSKAGEVIIICDTGVGSAQETAAICCYYVSSMCRKNDSNVPQSWVSLKFSALIREAEKRCTHAITRRDTGHASSDWTVNCVRHKGLLWSHYFDQCYLSWEAYRGCAANLWKCQLTGYYSTDLGQVCKLAGKLSLYIVSIALVPCNSRLFLLTDQTILQFLQNTKRLSWPI